MKTKITIFAILLSIFAVVMFFSCDNPVSLGTKLDLSGPVVTVVSPTQRQSVPLQFDIEGTVQDDSDVDIMLITAVKDNQRFPRQWRYKNGAWQVSDNYGATWSPLTGASWTGDKSVKWKITADMVVNGQIAAEGEITFNIQAWDKGGMSDDNSFRALVLIVDVDPPKVVITNPYLYSKYAYETDEDFKKFDAMENSSDDWKDPSYLGKFITQEFPLKWQIEDANDVWSINLSFYPYDTEIDNSPETLLPDNYIYRYYKNLPPPPTGADPNDYVRLNGSVTVPNLYDDPGIYDEGGELKTPISEKMTVKVVSVCYDAAGNPNQEKTLGYFISWPRANSPWIVFTEGIEPPDNFYGKQVAFDENNPSADYIEKDVFTVYPGRSVKATAFQAHGLKEVKYSLYKCNISGNILNRPTETNPFEDVFIGNEKQENIVKTNTAYGGTYSTIFPWEIEVPPLTGYYVFTAEAFSNQDKPSEEYTMLFRVHDITFPDFTEGPFPSASDPLFLDITNNKITVRGVVSDATNVVSLCMVWIDPESKDFAAMSQLSYFRDKDYKGWKKALTLTPGTSNLENVGEAYDDAHRNRLWAINLTPDDLPVDNETNRRRFKYSQVIDLTADLNIAADKQPLKSQVFLLRVQNPDGKCTIITYAPQGDTLAPDIIITKVVIPSAPNPDFIPNEYAVVPIFTDGNTITINGTWREDSLEILPIEDYFKKNFNITVNNQGLPLPILTSNPDKTTGTWTITATVKESPGGTGQIALSALKDTLVIGADVKDIGGNVAETGCSWLIESDNLRLMRISSEIEDGTYAAGEDIDIFLEFSKPVRLTNTVSGNKPELILNSAGGNAARAVYKDGQTNQNSRQYFTYTVGAGHSTGTGGWLNVTGLYYNGTDYSTSTPSDTSAYPFSWSRGSLGMDGYEEVRITMAEKSVGESYDGNTKESGGYYLRTLPTTTVTTNPDYQFTLTAGKHISIDTAAPYIDNIWANTGRGYYNSGEIYITAHFNKLVAITGTPRLILTGGNLDAKTSSTAGDVRVSGQEITFVYTIQTGDTTNGNPVTVSGFDNSMGTITDLAGNTLTNFGTTRTLQDSNSTLGDKNLYIETIAPGTPTFKILSTYMDNPTSSNDCIQQNINGTNVSGSSSSTVDLFNVYYENLWYTVQGNTTGDNATTPYKAATLEYAYSTNDGVSWSSWVAFANTNNTPQVLSQTGKSMFKARQKDKAGNISAETNTVSLNWDKGTLINRISSTSANGTYTNTTSNGGTRADTINITVYFRKKVKFSANPRITLNTNPTTTVTLNGYTLNTAVDSLSFTYSVGANHNTAGSTKLDVTTFDLNSGNAQDEANVRVNAQLGTPPSGSQLSDLKEIYVQTGPLTVQTAAAFNESLVSGGLATDGSYNTAVSVTFNRPINKGSGNITIIQSPTDYRLPAVLTETQFSKYSNIPNVNTYYTRASNGYINDTTGRKPDTSTKYVLKYSVDPTAITPSSTGDDLQKLAEAFRQTEKVDLSVYAQAVEINGAQLIVKLTDTNALQVPGVNYLVSYPVGFVQDNLSTPCPVATNQSLALGGVAKPFIRINKTQDSITAQTGSTTQPSFAATQPFQANVRMDCRTPGSTIYYFTTNATTTTNAVNFSITTGPSGTTAAPTQPSDPQTTETNRLTYSTPLTIGTASDYQGLQWYGRAKANKDGTWSVNSEEMAFKTVITYVVNNITVEAGSGITLGSGDQIWIRGGDAIGLSSVPGFPLNWDKDEHETVKAERKRAGIRLFTCTTTTALTASTWKFITWEINVDTYFDIILGRDSTSSAEEVFQYGPRQFAYQRQGWTSYKEQCRALPGQHRWLATNTPTSTKGALNFSATFDARAQYTGANITYP